MHQAIRENRISTVGGKIDPKVADREWEENTDQTKPRNSVSGNPQPGRGAGRPATTGLAKARAEREEIRVERERFEMDVERGLWLKRADVEKAAFNAARKARDQLTALYERISPLLTPEVSHAVEVEIERTCHEIAAAPRC